MFRNRPRRGTAPANSEIVWRFTDYLIENLRKDDALQFIRAAAKFNPKDEHPAGLLRYVEDWRREKWGEVREGPQSEA